MRDSYRSDLSDPAKRALVILLEDRKIVRHNGTWAGCSGRKVYLSTIEALYERYLCKIIAGAKYPRKHRVSDPDRMCFTAVLTEVGEFAAREIARNFIFDNAPPVHKISEQSALLIAEVVG